MAEPADAPALASAHAEAFESPWSAAELGRFAFAIGAFALVCEGAAGLAGFVICRSIAGEAEILTLAVRPEQRRRGVASTLLAEALRIASRSSAVMLLEVAADNLAAIALYRRAGFTEIGRRAAYYLRSRGGAVDALVMRAALNS